MIERNYDGTIEGVYTMGDEIKEEDNYVKKQKEKYEKKYKLNKFGEKNG